MERLIPYMCSHTGSANNQWAGAYGRPSGGAGVGTRVVTMALSSKQGAILHDRQADRIYTVREVARMHGFPDSFRFGVDEALGGGGGRGNGDMGAAAAATRGAAAAVARAITVAYHAVGNAVPPPFGAAVSRSVLQAHGR